MADLSGGVDLPLDLQVSVPTVGIYKKLPFAILLGGRSARKKIFPMSLCILGGGVDLQPDLPVDLANMSSWTFRCSDHRGLSLCIRPTNKKITWIKGTQP